MAPKVQPQTVKILLMEKHFLYLPLYCAEFKDEAHGKFAFFNDVPSDYKIVLKRPNAAEKRTDQGVFECLLDPRLDDGDVFFVVCDPTVLLDKPASNALIAATIIGSSAFWAVNHTTKQCSLISDLADFDKVICYAEKTTSHLIARRIVKNDVKKLEVVEATREIEALRAHGEGSLAISPEVLDIANLLGSKNPADQYKIVLDLATSKEFSNVLTTALLTRVDVIERHPQLVEGVLTALQKSLIAIHANNPIVIECAKSNFRDSECAEVAIQMAKSSNVFPETIQVQRDRWQRACEFYCISHCIAAGGKMNKGLSKNEEQLAEDLFQSSVKDRQLAAIVSRAIAAGFSLPGIQTTAISTPKDAVEWLCWKPFRIPLAITIALSCLAGWFFSAKLSLGLKAIILAFWALSLGVGCATMKHFHYPRWSKLTLVHWLSWSASVAIVALFLYARYLTEANPADANDVVHGNGVVFWVAVTGLFTVPFAVFLGVGFFQLSRSSDGR